MLEGFYGNQLLCCSPEISAAVNTQLPIDNTPRLELACERGLCCDRSTAIGGSLYNFTLRRRIYDESRVPSPDPTSRAPLRPRPREEYQCPQTVRNCESEQTLTVKARRELAHRRKRYVEEELRSCTWIQTFEDGLGTWRRWLLGVPEDRRLRFWIRIWFWFLSAASLSAGTGSRLN